MGPFHTAEIAMMVIVTVQVLIIAYLQSPRAKSMVYMLPIPVSTALGTTGRGIDATHLVGMAAVWAFMWLAWLLHSRWGLHIVLADACSAIFYCLVSLACAKTIPVDSGLGSGLYWACALVLLVGSAAALLLPCPVEPGHRSSMPVALKAVLVLILIALLLSARHRLRGFMPTFPLASVFTVYEARHSLKTFAIRFPIFIIGFIVMAAVIARLLPAGADLRPAQYILPLAAGWAVFLPTYLLLDRWYARRNARAPAQAG